MIGNGFDLAHGLPTEYADFLKFLELYVAEEKDLGTAARQYPEIVNFVNRVKATDNDLNKEVHDLLAQRNSLLTHFQSVCEKRRLVGKKGWVDFEAEIADIIQLFERARRESKGGGKRLSEDLTRSLYPFISAGRDEVYPFGQMPIVPNFYEKQAERRLDDLNRITRLLEIYLTEFVDTLKYVDPIPQIANLQDITHIISFNYTNTYQRLYGSNDTQYCYIHGKAKRESSVDTCNLVLGIDEYLKGEERDTDNAFIWFKKFYQRIYKETDSTYIDWLDKHASSLEVTDSFHRSHPILDIYFYGHSLDVTDKDVLSRLILHENAKIHIFYRNKSSMAKQITNLVKIIGEERLIHMTRGSNRSIIFEPIVRGL